MADDPLREVCEADLKLIGSAFFGDENAVCFYGRDASRFFAAGFRATSRMVLESCPDAYASQIAERVATLVSPPAAGGEIVLLEPFAGLGNLGYHLVRQIHPSRGFYFESNAAFADVARHNLQLLDALGETAGTPVNLMHATYAYGLTQIAPALRRGSSYVVVVDPPWGTSGQDSALGMDLRRTEPPVPVALRELSAALRTADPEARILYVLKTRALVQEASLRELEAGFGLAAREILAVPGSSRRFGLLALRCLEEPAKKPRTILNKAANAG
jgi:hypothetical protein